MKYILKRGLEFWINAILFFIISVINLSLLLFLEVPRVLFVAMSILAVIMFISNIIMGKSTPYIKIDNETITINKNPLHDSKTFELNNVENVFYHRKFGNPCFRIYMTDNKHYDLSVPFWSRRKIEKEIDVINPHLKLEK